MPGRIHQTASGLAIAQANGEGALFNIDVSTYDLWRGNVVSTAADYFLRWNVSRRMPQPRSPGSQYRLACEVAVLRDQLEEAGVYPWKRDLTKVVYRGWLDSLFRGMSREQAAVVFPEQRRTIGQRYVSPVVLEGEFTSAFERARQRGKSESEVMRVVSVDQGRRELTFTADAVYSRSTMPKSKSRVPAGLKQRRLDGRRSR